MCRPRKAAADWASLYSTSPPPAPPPGRQRRRSPAHLPPTEWGPRCQGEASWSGAQRNVGLPRLVLIDLPPLHQPLQLRRDGLIRQLPPGSSRHRHRAVTVGDHHSPARGPVQRIAHLGGKLGHSAQQGILFKNHAPIPVRVNLQGSPSRILMTRRISFGMTTRPKSSIRLTMPVAFIYIVPPTVVFGNKI